jgi:3-oxoacyl-[acyl-carrier protein] reductase
MAGGTLTGKRALVTGGSRGIGAAVVRRLVEEGAEVAFTYAASVDDADALRRGLADQNGVKVLAIKADSADPDQTASAVDEALSVLGGLDIVVNNAGVSQFGPIEQIPMEDFDRLVAINLRGAFSVIQRAVPHLAEGSRIINLGSVLGERSPLPGMSVYAMTKAAIGGLSRALARELGPRGITVNVIAPGPIATDANPEAGDITDKVTGLVALGRYGAPGEVADAVVYLAGPAAAYINGAILNVDGGVV